MSTHKSIQIGYLVYCYVCAYVRVLYILERVVSEEKGKCLKNPLFMCQMHCIAR